MNKKSIISLLAILIFSQSAFARDFKFTLCNNASSVNTARIIIYDADTMYDGLEAQPGQCSVKSMNVPNLIEVRVFYGADNSVPKYIRLSNMTALKVEHKNYYLASGQLAETTDLLPIY